VFSILIVYHGEDQLYKIGVENIMSQMKEMDYDINMYFKEKPYTLNHLLFYYMELNEFDEVEIVENQLKDNQDFTSSISYIHTKLHILTEFE